ncbi:MAG: 2'-5' RNA ligase family protein [Chloroflexota bacterium]
MNQHHGQDEALRRVWQAFRTFGHVEDGRHDTGDWRSREGVFALAAIRVPAAALQPGLDELRAALAGFPFVRLHPDGFLHITLQELGFVVDRPARPDEISPTRLEEFIESAATVSAARGPVDLALVGANSFQDAVFLDVHDRDALAALQARLFDLAAIPRARTFAYLPHCTIAHYTAEAPSTHLAATIGRFRDRPFGAFTASRIEVLTLRLDEPYPPFETVAVLPFRD